MQFFIGVSCIVTNDDDDDDDDIISIMYVYKYKIRFWCVQNQLYEN